MSRRYNNRDWPGLGISKMILKDKKSFELIDFIEFDGKVWLQHIGGSALMYDIEHLVYDDNGTLKKVVSVPKSKLSVNMYKDQILTETDNYILIKSSN